MGYRTSFCERMYFTTSHTQETTGFDMSSAKAEDLKQWIPDFDGGRGRNMAHRVKPSSDVQGVVMPPLIAFLFSACYP